MPILCQIADIISLISHQHYSMSADSPPALPKALESHPEVHVVSGRGTNQNRSPLARTSPYSCFCAPERGKVRPAQGLRGFALLPAWLFTFSEILHSLRLFIHLFRVSSWFTEDSKNSSHGRPYAFLAKVTQMPSNGKANGFISQRHWRAVSTGGDVAASSPLQIWGQDKGPHAGWLAVILTDVHQLCWGQAWFDPIVFLKKIMCNELGLVKLFSVQWVMERQSWACQQDNFTDKKHRSALLSHSNKITLKQINGVEIASKIIIE